MAATRLQSLTNLNIAVRQPAYDRDATKVGIFHFGPGAFFRAHLAAYTEDSLSLLGGDWAIDAASLRSAETAETLNEQNGLYTLLVRDDEQTSAIVVGALHHTYVAPRDPNAVLERLADPDIRIVSLTITEKAYCIDPVSGGLDFNHPDIRHDLETPSSPKTAIGFLVEGLRRRHIAGNLPFTPLSCDNLPDNGGMLRRLVLSFANHLDADFANWIDSNVPFPATMVDRITPASTDETYADAERLTGQRDLAAIETEPFRQWIIEDHFACGRPQWEEVGALIVEDVEAYEKMKLRMLNGAHSLLAYLGFIAGYEYIRDVMGDPGLAALARRHMRAAASTLGTVPGMDLEAYADELIARFANRAIAHKTYQIAMDGTQKLPQRLLFPANEALEGGDAAETYAIAVAAWMRYALGEDRHGKTYALRDPREAEIAERLEGVARNGAAVSQALLQLPGLFPPALLAHPRWTDDVANKLELLIQDNCLPLI
ncbi:mannitol dehydrogenase family protein [Oryzifoliimicrobium ureilyticus]|uniref:mannitol dehydrogenase family protein n=1 Tax=Oryzifoliimicrobium ureilyticus TaxID=3113724 RepID=UPI00307650D2